MGAIPVVASTTTAAVTAGTGTAEIAARCTETGKIRYRD
jgi:hypothetical protein